MRRFNTNKDLGILIMRLFVGSRLLYGVADNIFSWDRMLEFADFLKTFHFPFPVASAVTSVYAQALAGLCFIIGFYIQPAAVLMIINFLVALFMVHWGEPYDALTAPLAMLFASILFFFTGAGKYSLDREPL